MMMKQPNYTAKIISHSKFILVCIFMSCHQFVFAGWPTVATPPLTEVTPLANEIVYQGMPFKITTFKSKVSINRVFKFYRERWGKESVEDSFGPWAQISHKKDDYFITIQVQPTDKSSSHGRISIMQIPDEDDKSDPIGKGIALLPDTKVLNDISSNDHKTLSRSIIAQNKRSIETNGNYYQRHYTNKQWGLIMDKTVNTVGRVLMFRKDTKETVVVLKRIGQTSYIHINESNKKGWFK